MKLLFLLFGILAASRVAGADLTPIADPSRDPGWRDLLIRLAPNRTRESAFEERRYFRFRKEPVVLTGEIRISPTRGLSLSYLTPERRVLIADAKGLLMRDAGGRDRDMSDDPRARTATLALAELLRFDLPELRKSFVLRGRRDGDAWTLAFEARDEGLGAALGTIVITGERERLRGIEMIRSADRRIEIRIGETREDVVFSGDEVSRFFR